MDKATKTTHFVYEKVAMDEKTEKVGAVFDSVAKRYDFMNDLMSGGMHRLWKRFTIELCQLKKGQKVLDLASGTGDIAKRLARLVGPDGTVYMTDINGNMLSQGRDRLIDQGIAGNIEYVQVNAETLPFADNSMDCVTIAFGLRNVTDIDKALSAMYRVLKPGGQCLILEFSKIAKPLQPFYDLYSFNVLPLMGKLVVNDASSYRYLAESIRMFPDQQELLERMENAGFGQCKYHNLAAGAVALHKGYKI